MQPGTDRTVHQTLRAWIEAGTDAQRTAQTLGISRTTVRAHLRTAEQFLRRSLQTPDPRPRHPRPRPRVPHSRPCTVNSRNVATAHRVARHPQPSLPSVPPGLR
ncbi:helix-turn-helix domain-containing protein [Streptomyces chartreusis]|uniref:helix-turn-helix domain-containing protein n=1 Tax=Streptomyces chartreusis TaxID=1969 RepID=UPI0033B56C7B